MESSKNFFPQIPSSHKQQIRTIREDILWILSPASQTLLKDQRTEYEIFSTQCEAYFDWLLLKHPFQLYTKNYASCDLLFHKCYHKFLKEKNPISLQAQTIIESMWKLNIQTF